MKNILRIFFLLALLPWVLHAQFVPGVGASGTSAGSVAGGGGGGGGSPAGSSGDFQINSGGSFGAVTPGTGVTTAFGNATNGTGGIVTFSGNIGAATGTSLTLSGGGAAGYAEFTQGTAPSAGTTSIKLYAPSSVTSYIRALEATVGTTGYYKGTVSGTTVTDSKVATIPIADVAGGIQTAIATLTDAATVTPVVTGYGGGILTTLSQATQFLNPTGSPIEGQTYTIRIKSTTTRALTYDTQYRGSSDLALPSATTGSSKTDYLIFSWNVADSKWDLLGKTFGF